MSTYCDDDLTHRVATRIGRALEGRREFASPPAVVTLLDALDVIEARCVSAADVANASVSQSDTKTIWEIFEHGRRSLGPAAKELINPSIEMIAFEKRLKKWDGGAPSSAVMAAMLTALRQKVLSGDVLASAWVDIVEAARLGFGPSDFQTRASVLRGLLAAMYPGDAWRRTYDAVLILKGTSPSLTPSLSLHLAGSLLVSGPASRRRSSRGQAPQREDRVWFGFGVGYELTTSISQEQIEIVPAAGITEWGQRQSGDISSILRQLQLSADRLDGQREAIFVGVKGGFGRDIQEKRAFLAALALYPQAQVTLLVGSVLETDDGAYGLIEERRSHGTLVSSLAEPLGQQLMMRIASASADYDDLLKAVEWLQALIGASRMVVVAAGNRLIERVLPSGASAAEICADVEELLVDYWLEAVVINYERRVRCAMMFSVPRPSEYFGADRVPADKSLEEVINHAPPQAPLEEADAAAGEYWLRTNSADAREAWVKGERASLRRALRVWQYARNGMVHGDSVTDALVDWGCESAILVTYFICEAYARAENGAVLPVLVQMNLEAAMRVARYISTGDLGEMQDARCDAKGWVQPMVRL